MSQNLDVFVRWPKKAQLLWRGCDRVPATGEPRKYHDYPRELKVAARAARIPLDARPNGPAIAAFLLAGGERPQRFGNQNQWSIHHIYSGKFEYPDRATTLHAPKHQDHFTQSAGLVAVHPLADGLCDEYPAFAWLLRAKSFQRFGYDPDVVFSTAAHDAFGFVEPFSWGVLFDTESRDAI